jgi:hypothetical protein
MLGGLFFFADVFLHLTPAPSTVLETAKHKGEDNHE